MLSKKVITFLICIAIASLLWAVRALNRNYSYSLLVPVKFENLPSNKLIVGEIPEKLNIDIRTSGLKLLFISLKKMNQALAIDFNSLKTNAKSQAYSIGNANINLKSILNYDVDIVKIRPDTLFFASNKGKTKLVPLKANLEVECIPGYSLISKPQLNPAFINISGDSSDITAIDTIYTQRLNLKGIKENYLSPVRLVKPNANANFNLNTKTANLSFSVDRVTETSLKIPVQILNKTSKATVKLLPESVTVTYQVSMHDYDNVTPSSFKAVVDYQQIIKKEKFLKVDLVVTPSEVKVLKIQPNSISYLIYK